GTDDLVGYIAPDTPSFNDLNARAFATNAEVCAYADALAARCDYLYVFYPFELTAMGNREPVMVFTKDEIAPGATLEQVAATVRGGGPRDIFLITGGVHGNEPAGEEGTLFFAKQLCGSYGEDVLDAFGAIVILPASCPDNLQRFKRLYADGYNVARDSMALYSQDMRNYVAMYNLFAPTVTLECHEDSAVHNSDYTDNAYNDLFDIGFHVSGAPNGAIQNICGLISGYTVEETRGYRTVASAIERLQDTGIRAGHYLYNYYNPGFPNVYGSARSSYSFLIEVMRIWTGKERYARAVFSMAEAIKAYTDIIAEADGAFATEVAAARAAAPVVTYDENRIFVTKLSASGNTAFYTDVVSAYADGTQKPVSAKRKSSLLDTIVSYKTMPTGYVLPADSPHIDGILQLMDLQGISYTELQPGAKLNLRAYTLGDTVTLGDVAEVTFADGAYVFLTNTADAYFTAYFFEPDSYPASATDEYEISLYQMGLLSAGDALYRSETDHLADVIAAMLPPYAVLNDGAAYDAFAARAGVHAFTVIATDDSVQEQPALTLSAPSGAAECYLYELCGEYILPVTFTAEDGKITFAAKNQTVYACASAPLVTYGDANGDGDLSLGDVLRILRHLSDPTVTLDKAAADITHSRSIQLLDALTTLRAILAG
ncbi:MAG: hypothetical protein IJU41_02675, partial [Clostridia bacterium]|nr:hypothetical protein [Clostridia bacterium]